MSLQPPVPEKEKEGRDKEKERKEKKRSKERKRSSPKKSSEDSPVATPTTEEGGSGKTRGVPSPAKLVRAYSSRMSDGSHWLFSWWCLDGHVVMQEEGSRSMSPKNPPSEGNFVTALSSQTDIAEEAGSDEGRKLGKSVSFSPEDEVLVSRTASQPGQQAGSRAGRQSGQQAGRRAGRQSGQTGSRADGQAGKQAGGGLLAWLADPPRGLRLTHHRRRTRRRRSRPAGPPPASLPAAACPSPSSSAGGRARRRARRTTRTTACPPSLRTSSRARRPAPGA